MRMRRWAFMIVGAVWLFALPVHAEQVELRVSDGPYYAGVPIELQVVAEDFEESPQPVVEVAELAQGSLELTGVSPSVSSSIQVINGRMKQWKSVRFHYNYRFFVEKTGRYRIGPFTVRQGNKEARTQAVTLKVGEIPTGGDQRVLLLLPKGSFFVGQRIPVRLEWWIQTDLVEKLVQHEAYVPLFEMIETFRFLEEEEDAQGKASNALPIHTASGFKKFPATTRQTRWQGASYIVLTVARTAIPLKSGEHVIAPSRVILEEGVRWRRSLFGQRTATHVRKLRIQDKKRVLSVKPLPQKGRPPSFAGAIGQGFTLDVSARRTILQAGDPLPLTLTLRGESASVAAASLPPLAEGGGLSTQDFRVPEGNIAGVVQEGSKRFEVMVRVLHEGIKEIPPIAYSWFDPDRGTYQTTYSQPVALSVGAAQVVSAGDVVRHQGSEQTPQRAAEVDASMGQTPSSVSDGSSSPAEKAPAFTLMGADLSIERDPHILLDGRRSFLAGGIAQTFCYLLGGGLIALAVWGRRRSALDPEVMARQKELKRQWSKLENAVSVQDIADSLRQMAALRTDFPRQELDALLETCDNLLFAPGGSQVRVDKALQERALRLIRRIMEEKS